MSDSKEISETVKAANIYLSRLKNLNDKIQTAEQQICTTSEEAEETIKVTFNTLLTNITQILNNRKDTLIRDVRQIKQQSLSPLEECQNDIVLKIQKTKRLISEGHSLLNGATQNIEMFSQNSSLLGSLPEIPELKEVPYISFHCNLNLESQLLDTCLHFGDISRIAPIQISQTNEKPGAILVEWQNVDSDCDIQEFRLQKAFGDVTVHKHLTTNFSDCFLGLDTQFLVRELQANQPYSFRVCCKFEGSNEWSPWSLPQVSVTTIKPFSWADNKDFIFANDQKIAVPTLKAPSLLLSDGPQFAIGYSIEFTYLECNEEDESTVGLIVPSCNEIEHIKAENQNYFAVDSTGEIFVDGIKKSTKLPKTVKGSKICFTCELTHNDIVRVNIDSCDKRVTYDWHINKSDKLYFAALLTNGSKIMVE